MHTVFCAFFFQESRQGYVAWRYKIKKEHFLLKDIKFGGLLRNGTATKVAVSQTPGKDTAVL